MTIGQRGLFVVFEGGEATGKSTQARRLADTLELHNISTYLTREPGSTRLGARIRDLIMDPESGDISRKAEMLLFAADRADHVENVVMPALTEGKLVICDRFRASTMAYQAFAGGLNADKVDFISDYAAEGLQPDITFFIDLDPRIGLDRASKRNNGNRFDEKPLDYHQKIRKGFKMQRDDSWVTIDGEQTIDEIHNKVADHVMHVLHVLRKISTDPTRLFRHRGSKDPIREMVRFFDEKHDRSSEEKSAVIYWSERTTKGCHECGQKVVALATGSTPASIVAATYWCYNCKKERRVDGLAIV